MNKKKDKVMVTVNEDPLMRNFLIVGNWKMHKLITEAKTFIETLGPLLKSNLAQANIKVGIAAPFTILFALTELVKTKSFPILIGAQNMHEKTEGAYTGEISALMLKDVGAQFVLLGHSERRHLFQESNERINLKVHKALQEKLDVILCVGELLKDREEGKTEAVLKLQIQEGLKGVENLEHVTLAYEPVWAIGTGKIAHPDDVQKIHAFCRLEITKLFGKQAAEKLIIQYGGSVQGENAVSLAKQPDIDGLLIGGAALKIESFEQIIQKCGMSLGHMI